jgi:hypothetical protein
VKTLVLPPAPAAVLDHHTASAAADGELAAAAAAGVAAAVAAVGVEVRDWQLA